jgi:hypothetical protein
MRVGALTAVSGLALVGVASSQVQWNELPLAEGVFRECSADYRTGVIDIPLEPLGELEYKLGLNEGDSIVYQWDGVISTTRRCYTPSSMGTHRLSTTSAI